MQLYMEYRESHVKNTAQLQHRHKVRQSSELKTCKENFPSQDN
jgi:hypothetical protein